MATAADGAGDRLGDLIAFIAAQPRTLADVHAAFGRRAGRRTLFADLRALRTRYPGQFRATRVRGDAHRVEYAWTGPHPHRVARPLAELGGWELIALVVARGLLRAPGAEPGRERGGYSGPLAGALDGLLRRLGLADAAGALVPDTFGVSRFGAQAEDPQVFLAVAQALLAGRCLRFTYENLKGETKRVHVRPHRLVFLKGGWQLFAAADRVKQYVLARIRDAEPTAAEPPGCARAFIKDGIDDILRRGFGATAMDGPAVRVRLAVSPAAWPHVRGRVWGERQEVDADRSGLPAGWHRIAFTTAGLVEARYWVLSLGAEMRAESPPDLVAWLRSQAGELLTHAGPSRATVQATAALGRATSSPTEPSP